MNTPRAIILAAGEGTRLRPYTLDRPKCMVEVCGRSLLDMQLDGMQACGIEDRVLIKGYLADAIVREGVRTYLNPVYASTNMVWTLMCAREEFDTEVIVSYGDIVYAPSVLQSLLASSADFSVIVDQDWKSYWEGRMENPLDDAETLKLDAAGCITEIGQKPSALDQIQGQYIGLMKFSKTAMQKLCELFDEAADDPELLGRSREKAYMTDLLQAAIKAGEKLTAVDIHGEWVEVDSVEDLERPITRNRIKDIQSKLGDPEA